MDKLNVENTAKLGKNNKAISESYINGESVVGENNEFILSSYITNSKIGDNNRIIASVIEESEIGSNVSIGPYAHLRPFCKIGDKCRIGNFVEIKNAIIGNGSKVGHLAYVGDAEVGENCNIGCGVIFANYNGREKNKIKVGNNVFIGSNCNIIAPVVIEDNVYICAGTTVTKNLKEGDFVIGRSREEIKADRAKDYLKEKE